jgi:hypothetical protein
VLPAKKYSQRLKKYSFRICESSPVLEVKNIISDDVEVTDILNSA